jgi:hypothetical protein
MRRLLFGLALLAGPAFAPGQAALAQARPAACEPMPACLVLQGPEPGRPGYTLPRDSAPLRSRETLLPSPNAVPTAPPVPKPR